MLRIQWKRQHFKDDNLGKWGNSLTYLSYRAYGVAVAHFHSAHDGDKDFSMADEMLQTALINFPGVLLPLLDKCSIDAEDKVARHPFFVDSQRGQVRITQFT